jgi:bla regulator protein blaR1
MIPANLIPLANHLWQSTVFGALMWLLTLVFRKNFASIRYSIWFAASVKFLIPFSLLFSLGSQFEWQYRPAIVQPPAISFVVKQISQPFDSRATPQAVTPLPLSSHIPAILFGVWLCGCTIGVGAWLRWFQSMRETRRLSKPLLWNHVPIPVMLSDAKMEPGVFGIIGSVLLLPEGIIELLTPEQLETVITHELCHVHRRDNLTAAIHMIVETIFWFHPLVWWIRARLIEERERACDESVLKAGQDPQVYAAAILTVCKFCLASPLMDVSGITGANLKKRIESILSSSRGCKLSAWKIVLLAVATVAALAGPAAAGVLGWTSLQSPTVSPLAFEVATVKQLIPGTSHVRVGWCRGVDTPEEPLPPFKLPFEIPLGRCRIEGPLGTLISTAYYRPPLQVQWENMPTWQDDVYEVIGKAENTSTIKQADLFLMLQTFLAERFKLKFHEETRQVSGMALLIGKNGSKLTKGTDKTAMEVHLQPPSAGAFTLPNAPLAMLAGWLSFWLEDTVVDMTGSPGVYDIKLSWDDSVGPSLSTALQEQLGLRLLSQKVPATVVVIDYIERPSLN